MTAGMTAYERVVLGFFFNTYNLPFLSESLASPSRLPATGYRSHPITLFVDFVTVYATRTLPSVAKKVHVAAKELTKCEEKLKNGAVWLFRRNFFSQGKCAMLSNLFLFSFFFLVFFSPVAIADFLSAAAHREAGRSAGDGGRKIQIIMCYLGHF